MWDLYNKYGPVARLLLDRFSPAANSSGEALDDRMLAYERKLDTKMVDFLQADADIFSESHFGSVPKRPGRP
jgi:hypothetical protein